MPSARISRSCLAVLLAVIGLLCPAQQLSAHDHQDKSPTEIAGTVVDEKGQPVEGVEVVSKYYNGQVSARSNSDGRFTATVPKGPLSGLCLWTTPDSQERVALTQLSWEPKLPLSDLKLVLKPAKKIEIVVDDGQGNPISDARIYVQSNYNYLFSDQTKAEGKATLRLSPDAVIHNIVAIKQGKGIDYHCYFDPQRTETKQPQPLLDNSKPVTFSLEDAKTIQVQVLDADSNEPIKNQKVDCWLLKKESEVDTLNLSYFYSEFDETTNEEGIATFDWIPPWENSKSLQFWAHNKDYENKRGTYDSAQGNGTLTMKLHRLVPITGRVTRPDGQAASGIGLAVNGAGYDWDDFRGSTTTDEHGRYEIKVAPHQIYMIVVIDKEYAAAPVTGFAIEPAKPREFDIHSRTQSRSLGR